METVEPRVWHWLCLQVVEKELGRLGVAPLLQVKRMPTPKCWTIVVDCCTAHASGPGVSVCTFTL